MKNHEKLFFVRKCMGLSQREFCFVFGFNLSTYKQWEQNRSNFPVWLIPLLVHAVRDLGYFVPLSLTL